MFLQYRLLGYLTGDAPPKADRFRTPLQVRCEVYTGLPLSAGRIRRFSSNDVGPKWPHLRCAFGWADTYRFSSNDVEPKWPHLRCAFFSGLLLAVVHEFVPPILIEEAVVGEGEHLFEAGRGDCAGADPAAERYCRVLLQPAA